MRIKDVRTHLLTSRWADDPTFPAQFHSTAFVEIITDAGIRGVGETILGYFIPDAVAPIVNFYKPLLIDNDPERLNAIYERLFVSSIYWGRTGAAMSVLSAIDMALWDIKAKVAGVPLYQLLGGLARNTLPLYASGGPALWPIEENIAKCKRYVEQGYRSVKFATGYYVHEGPPEIPTNWRVKPSPTPRIGAQEGEKCAAVREALGPEIDIILDGHQGGISNPYSVSDALHVVEAIAPYGIQFFEEPLPYTDVAGYAVLRRQGKLAIGGGESLSGLFEFQNYFERDCLDVAQPEVTYVGGVTACVAISRELAIRNLRLGMHCGGTIGPGLAASIHISFASTTAITLEHVPSSVTVQKDTMLEPVQMRDGAIDPPTAPGIGIVEITDKLLAKYPYVAGSGEVCC